MNMNIDNFDHLEENDDLLGIENKNSPKEFKAKLQFGSISKVDCNIILALPKNFKAKLGQLS